MVTPYLKQWGPPAFSAMLPPVVAVRPLAGSGGKYVLGLTTRQDKVDDARLDNDAAADSSNSMILFMREADDDASARRTAPPIGQSCTTPQRVSVSIAPTILRRHRQSSGNTAASGTP